jgi:hypothetical protein
MGGDAEGNIPYFTLQGTEEKTSMKFAFFFCHGLVSKAAMSPFRPSPAIAKRQFQSGSRGPQCGAHR